MNSPDKAAILAAMRANQDAALTRRAPPPGQRRQPPQQKQRPDRRCSSGKTRFTTRAAAETRLGEVHGQSHTGRMYGPVNVDGPCRKCGGWHLTSKEKKPWKHGKRKG